MKLSATQLESFDSSTPFGCKRKWWWKYVQKVSSPPDAGQQLGIDVHKSIENYITGDETNCLHPIAMNGKQWIDQAKAHTGSKQTEQKFSMQLFGHEFVGVVDYLNDTPRLLDWKTTSNVKKYAKTKAQLLSYIPMVLYAKWFFETHPQHDKLDAGLVYLQTKGKKADLVPAVFTRENVEAELPRLQALVKDMEAVAQKASVQEVEGCFDKCDVGRGCPYNNLCHGDVMSLFDRFSSPKKIVIQDVPPQTPQTQDVFVLPPDAPKSNPELASDKAAQPVVPPPTQAAPVSEAPLKAEAPTANPAKRGPGRPRKTVSEPETKTVEKTQTTTVTKATATVTAQPHKVSVRHSLTINLGNYESAKVEVELEGEDGFDNVNERVKDSLAQALKPYQELKAQRLAGAQNKA